MEAPEGRVLPPAMGLYIRTFSGEGGANATLWTSIASRMDLAKTHGLCLSQTVRGFRASLGHGDFRKSLGYMPTQEAVMRECMMRLYGAEPPKEGS